MFVNPFRIIGESILCQNTSCKNRTKVDRHWFNLQALRLVSLVLFSACAGASVLGIIHAQSAQLAERVAKTEYQSQLNQQNLERVVPRVDQLEIEMGKIYGIGLAVSVILGMLHAGQLVLAFKKERTTGGD